MFGVKNMCVLIFRLNIELNMIAAVLEHNIELLVQHYRLRKCKAYMYTCFS